MTLGEVLPFPREAATPRIACARTTRFRGALDELHALLSLDSIAGAAPARVLFVASDEGRARLVRHICPADGVRAWEASACALVGYDFAFAAQLLQSSARALSREATIRLAARSAALQGVGLAVAAREVGLEAEPVALFDAAGLKAEFFAGTGATVTFLCRLIPSPGDQHV
jgi:hypothetical protein